MDILTPLANVAAGQDHSACIPSTCAAVRGDENTRPRNASSAGDGISLNARRLKLRNAGFRAALLPTRRLSPPQQTSIGGGLVKSENIENATVGCVKARHYSNPDSTAPLNILWEIRNCSQRKTTPRSSLGDLFSFADDEDEEVDGQDRTNTMSSRAGSIRAPKSRKSSRRVSSFQSTKYIEYLENELGLATRKLETLQSPETINGQAAKIRKLEKRTQELSQHLVDWEKNFEERVNDQVFERLHGESDLRLKILTLEQAAAHKETHISELSKELEDAKTKIEEAESIEATLSRRVDVLTELLAKSPTRTSFTSSTADFPTPTRPAKLMVHRVSTSPTRCSQRIEDFDEIPQIDSVALLTNTSNPFDSRTNESAIETDTESQDFSIFSRPTSGIFSSRSSQTSSSRPTSMFSTASVSAWTSADEKPISRARKSRRFAPGSAGLKPLLLATNAGLQSPTRSFETPRKGHLESQSISESCLEPVEDLSGFALGRPALRRPYSWACSPNVTKHTSIIENVESEEDIFIASTIHNDNLPAYLRHLVAEESVPVVNRSQRSSSPSPAGLSLYQELNTEQSFIGSSDDLIQAHDSPVSSVISQGSPNSSFVLMEQRQCLQPDIQGAIDGSFVSEFSETIIKSNLDRCRTEPRSPLSASSLTLAANQPQTSHLAVLIMTLKQKPLNLARGILLQSWSQGSARLSRLIWRVVDLFSMPCKKSETPKSLRKSATNYPGPSPDHSPIHLSTKSAIVDCDGVNRPTRRLEITKILSKLQKFAFPASNHRRLHRCSCCVEPPGKRSFQLWSKLIMALVVAIGCAVLEGPAAVLDTEQLDQCTTDTLLRTRRDDEQT